MKFLIILGEEEPACFRLDDRSYPESKALQHPGDSISPSWKIEMIAITWYAIILNSSPP